MAVSVVYFDVEMNSDDFSKIYKLGLKRQKMYFDQPWDALSIQKLVKIQNTQPLIMFKWVSALDECKNASLSIISNPEDQINRKPPDEILHLTVVAFSRVLEGSEVHFLVKGVFSPIWVTIVDPSHLHYHVVNPRLSCL